MVKKLHPAAKKADILSQTSMLYMAGNFPTDYGTGEKYTPVEVHLLEYIVDHPGKTVTELSQDFDKTKAAISQMMKKIENKGLVRKEDAPDSRRKQLYYATEKGKDLNLAHVKYDDRVFGYTLALMEEHCSAEEIETCFKVLQQFILARRQKHYLSPKESD